MGSSRRALLLASAWLLAVAGTVRGQVVAEPANLPAGVPDTETFSLYLAFPENSFVVGGDLRFPVSRDVDIGGRAGMWFRDDADDSPFAGADVRYGLLSRALTPGGRLNLTFTFGLGVSDPGATIWRIPLGFLAGLGFGRGGRDAEIWAHPRVDFAFAASGGDEADAALVFDVGGMFPITPPLSGVVSLRFGDGVFGEGDQVVVALGALWRL